MHFLKVKRLLLKGVWQERSVIIFLVVSGILLIDVIKGNFFSSFQGISADISSGYIKPGSDMV
jgi:hypothetical protein